MNTKKIKTAINVGNFTLSKNHEIILLDVLNIIKKYIDLRDVIGIYLTGSYARMEENKDSDIDILVITKDTDRGMINEGIYSILVISSELLKQKLKYDLFPVGQMIKEAKPLLNYDYLNLIKINVTRKNVYWYLKTTEEKLKIIKKVLEKIKNKSKKNVSDIVVYTLVLRIRVMHIINKLIKHKDYSNKEFVKIIKQISRGTNAYEMYLAVKNNLEEKNIVSVDEAERLYEYLKNQLAKVKKLI